MLLLLFVLFATCTSLANAEIVKYYYVILLKESVATPAIKVKPRTKNREQNVRDSQPTRNRNIEKVHTLLATYDIDRKYVKHIYADALVGFSAMLTPEQVAALQRNPDVQDVYEDHRGRLEFFFIECKPI
jgi:hypothetical protein